MAIYAFEHLNSDLVCFYGDDITLLNDNYYDQIISSYEYLYNKQMSSNVNLPYYFGCVVLKEFNGPNFPCFPIVSKVHYEMFNDFLPDVFINQYADPFLYELYERFGYSVYTNDICIKNERGGLMGGLTHDLIVPTAYERKSVEWRTTLLKEWMNIINTKYGLQPNVSISVITPIYRLFPNEFQNVSSNLERIINLKTNHKMSIRFVWIIDNPKMLKGSIKKWFQEIEKKDDRIRIRVNDYNRGASYSRAKGWQECHSEWVIYLDDDVEIKDDLLIQYVEKINENASIGGAVGLSKLEYDNKISTSAVHFAQTSFFWYIAEFDMVSNDIPWGVTANIMFKWIPGLEFDEIFPKTGGGEDIQFCIDHFNKLHLPLVAAPKSIVIHPWWNNGNIFSLMKRHYKWALGDGLLIKKNPLHSFYSFPNLVELILILLPYLLFHQSIIEVIICLIGLIISDVIAHCIFIYFHQDHFYTQFRRIKQYKYLAILLSGLVRNASKSGQLISHLKHMNFTSIFKRFDWFINRLPNQPYETRKRDFIHFLLYCIVLYICLV